ncbi:hypothetical protein COEREDRAFT_87007 [Coemansia reversa NRRL 1564]|uniref:Uncharacterized protein n=1 Tax=Coemansia reversa (strain ATCC 12441 / NRRL 1564) TaxID=763665 RepID=A0A2G5BB91_COERN|nr:hypothetical protein COEREDRAFT_87007 [Coemansia reversa NRRL 1564]|eukprot:PIA16284.1 hypothetical protein COEREDRAFT_87007 [Coemansia reversa NRRL 1564]
MKRKQMQTRKSKKGLRSTPGMAVAISSKATSIPRDKAVDKARQNIARGMDSAYMRQGARGTPAEAAACADIESRIFKYRLSEKVRIDERLIIWHRADGCGRQSSEAANRCLLVGEVRALRLGEPGEYEAAVGVGFGGTRAVSPDSDRTNAAIEDKRTAFVHGARSGAQHGFPKVQTVVEAQHALLNAHAQHIGALVEEAEAVAVLMQHNSRHPMHVIGRGLERYFGGLIDSLSLKQRLIAVEMYHTLYAPRVLEATERLSGILRDRQTSLAKEQGELDERLAIYRDAGGEFAEIAAAYSAVLRDMDGMRRDIARLRRL